VQNKDQNFTSLSITNQNSNNISNSASKPSSSFSIRKRIGLSLFTSFLFLTSCGGNRENLLKEITEFDKSVQVGMEEIAVYYSSANEQELNTYLLVLELNPNCEAGDFIDYKCLDPNFKGPGKTPTPLKQPAIPMASIQARISLLRELADYSKSIATIAGNDSPEKFQGSVKTLQTRLISLEQKFQLLQNQPGNSPDSTISVRYLKPITTIIGILGKIAIEEAKWSAIRNSIIEAEAPVNTVLKSVGNDLDTYILPLTTTDADLRYSLLIDYYNNNRLRFTQVERNRIVTKIADYKKTYDLVTNNKPSKIPNDLLESHKSLVKLAKSNGSVKDIAELKAWLDKFKSDVEQLKEAVNQLSQIQKVKQNGKSKNSAFNRKYHPMFGIFSK
jgi:hypothetical protein